MKLAALTLAASLCAANSAWLMDRADRNVSLVCMPGYIGTGQDAPPLDAPFNAIFAHAWPRNGVHADRLLFTATFIVDGEERYSWRWVKTDPQWPNVVAVLPLPVEAELISVDVEAFDGDVSVWWSGFPVAHYGLRR